FSQVESTMKRVSEGLDANAARAKQNCDERIIQANSTAAVIMVVAIGLVLGAALWLIRSIKQPLRAMADCARSIAGGNLSTTDMPVTVNDDLGALTRSINEMKNNLAGLIRSIASSGEQIASASEELSSSANEQAQGAETEKDRAAQVAT